MNNTQYPINISAPNLVNVCIDESLDGEIAGRLYHCYEKESLHFVNLIQLLRMMEKLFDEIQFPQSSTKSRSFFAANIQMQEEKQKIISQEEVVHWAGKKATFIITVQFRQNATWQGLVLWVEKGEKQKFSSTLDLIKILDGDLTLVEIEENGSEYIIGR